MPVNAITPGLYWDNLSVNVGGNTHPWLTHAPGGGGLGDYYIPLAAAAETFTLDPVPTAVLDIYRVAEWRLEAVFTDPDAGAYTRTLTAVFNAGTFHDTYFGADWPGGGSPPYAGPAFGTTWASIEDSINRKGTSSFTYSTPTEVLSSGTRLAGVRIYNEADVGGVQAFWQAGVVIARPVLRVNDADALEWALPVTAMRDAAVGQVHQIFPSLAGTPDPVFGFAFANSEITEGGELNEEGRTKFITAFGEETGPVDDPDPPAVNGWVVTLSIESYFA